MKKLVALLILFVVAGQVFSQVISLKDQPVLAGYLHKNKLQRTKSFLFLRTTITSLNAIHREEGNFRNLPTSTRRLPAAGIRVPLFILSAGSTHKAICLSLKKEKAFVPGKGSFNQKSFAALTIKFPITN